MFGAMALLGAPLTMASIAVLPVLLGLGVDYAIQYQARVQEDGDACARRASRCRRSPPRRWPPASASSCCCSRRCRWCAGSARCWSSASASRFVLALTAGHGGADARRAAARATAPLARSLRGAGELRRRRRARRSGARSAGPPARAGAARARRAAAARARAGGRRSSLAARRLGRSTRGPRSSPTSPRLVPQDLRGGARPRRAAARRPAWPARSTCSSRARDLTDPKVVAWMRDYQARRARALRLLGRERLRARRRCARRCRCPTCSARRAVGRRASRSARCSTRCRRTSRRPSITPDRKTADARVRDPAAVARAPAAR